jgi:SAM-dependent methyltransferase
VKHRLLRALMPLGIYPHINFTYSPFKILEYEAMLEWLPPPGGGTALDIGCGDGLHTMLLGRRFARTCGVGVNERFIAIAREHARAFGARANLEFFAQPLEQVGFAADTFDVVLSVCVLEHIPNHEEVLRECLRIMKPGARIVFSVDTLETIAEPDLVESHRRQHHVVRYFREDTLRELLARTGFVNLEFRPLFRSDLARDLFREGIREGFNFGRLRAPRLAAQLRRAEAAMPAGAPGTFLLARGERPR